ncbi:MAG: hypothetical protein M1827_004092 [Pycnora praestabilis]|nr:MAG: hypothetical protein M1827_004092 [Pycnora praestabilis]
MPSNAKLAETVKNLRAEKEDLTTRNAVLESRVTALKKQVPGDATVKAAFITRLKEDRAKYYELSDTRGSALACIGIMIPISFLQSGARALGDDIYAGDLSYEEKIALAKAEPNRMQVSAQSYMEALRRSKIKMLDCMSSMHTLLSEGEQSEEVQEVMKAIGVLLKETNGNISRKEEKAAKRTRAQLFQVMAKPSDEAEKKVEKGLVKRTSPEEMGLRASERAAEKFSMDGGLKVADGVKY